MVNVRRKRHSSVLLIRFSIRPPSAFYDGDEKIKEKETTSADTGAGNICVKTQSGKIYKVKAAGVYTFLHDIVGIGKIRQRYPIYPVHGEGSSVWKELNAYIELMKKNNM